MTVHATHSYAKDSLTVFEALVDRGYNQKKFEAVGSTNIDISECGKSGNQYVIKVQRDVPSNPPAFAKAFLKATNTIVETYLWDATDAEIKNGTFEVDIKGTPITMSGKLRLQPDGKGGSENVIETEVKVSIPLIGGKIASFIEGDVKRNLDEDYRFTKSYVESL